MKTANSDCPLKERPDDLDACVGQFHYNTAHTKVRLLQRLREILDFFTPDVMVSLVQPIARATFDVSLRLLDYCCTNYAKTRRPVSCVQERTYHIYSLYKDWLRRYRRRCFDPFRRRERIYFQDDTGEWLTTTIAQLNFLYWADRYGVIAYVRRNAQKIESDMMRTLCASKRRRLDRVNLGPKQKRTELSRNPHSKVTVYHIPETPMMPWPPPRQLG